MKIAMIGAGYVGLVSGACFADFGHEVICADKDKARIDSLQGGQIPIHEPGLARLVQSNMAAGRLHFVTDARQAVSGCSAVFVAVGTPGRREDGGADVSGVMAAVESIIPALEKNCVLIVKSTVPVGSGDKVEEAVRTGKKSREGIEVVSNPEFLREGSAIEDFKRPDRIVIGGGGDRAREVMRELYRPLYLHETPMVFTDRRTAELIKYAANAFLATKITFINEMSDICESLGADVRDVARAMGLDNRIGAKFLHPGPGYGGSCFPKDTRALVQAAESGGSRSRIVEAVIEANDRRKRQMADRIAHLMGGVDGKRIAILGVTFKPNTDDMRDAASVEIIPKLLAGGARVSAYDPAGAKAAREILPGVEWHDSALEAVKDSDAIVILTEWDEFRALDPVRLRSLASRAMMIDLRNIYNPEEMRMANFDYHCLGQRSDPEESGGAGS